jgi:hypothetical protein
LLREDIANSLCDIAQASLLTLGGCLRRSVAAMIASAKNNADENETAVRQASAPTVLIDGAVRVMSSH